MDEAMKQRVNLSPKVMAGKPVIRGTRIPVELIVRVLAHRGGAATKEASKILAREWAARE